MIVGIWLLLDLFLFFIRRPSVFSIAIDNEERVGKAFRESGIPREDIFITTKLW